MEPPINPEEEIDYYLRKLYVNFSAKQVISSTALAFAFRLPTDYLNSVVEKIPELEYSHTANNQKHYQFTPKFKTNENR